MSYISGEENAVALDHKYVFIVLECARSKSRNLKEESPEKIHGVYTSREIANGKVSKLRDKYGVENLGYLCVLKKTIQGPTKRPLFSY